MKFWTVEAREDKNIWIPNIGDKVVLTDDFYETTSDGKECAKLARLEYCTVNYVSPIPIGKDGDYVVHYEIMVEETEYLVGLHYKKYEL